MALPWPLWYLEACRVLSYPGSHAGNVAAGTLSNNDNNNSGNNVAGNNNNNVADHHQHFAVLEMMQKMAYHHQQQQQQQILKHQQKFNNNNTATSNNNNNNSEEESSSVKSAGDEDEDDEDDKRDSIIPPQRPQQLQPQQPQLQPQQPPREIGDDDDEDEPLSNGTTNVDKSSDSVDDDDDYEAYLKQDGRRTKTSSHRTAAAAAAATTTTTTSNNSNTSTASTTATASNATSNANSETTTESTFHQQQQQRLHQQLTSTPLGKEEHDDKDSLFHLHGNINNNNQNNHTDYIGGSKRRKQPRKNVTSARGDLDLTGRKDGVSDRYHSDDDQVFVNLPRLKRELRDEAEGGVTNDNDQSHWGDFQNGDRPFENAAMMTGSPKIQSRRLGLLAHHGMVPSKSGGKPVEAMNQNGFEEQTNGDGGQASSDSTRSDDVDDDTTEDENKALYGLLRNPAFNPWAFPENLASTAKGDPGRNGLESVGSPGPSSLSLMDRRFMPSPPLSPSLQQHHHHHHHSSNNNSSNSQQQWTYEEQFKQLYELSDDPKRKEFLDDLFSFMQKRGTPVNRIPIMAKQTLDLYELFHLVVSKGGLVEVINKKLWREITKGLNLPSSITSAAFTLRTQYMKYLYPYECERLKLSTLSELQYAVDGNRREGRRPGGFGEDTPRGPSMPSLISPLQNHSILSGLSQLNPASLGSGYQDGLSGLSRRTPIAGQANCNQKDKEISPNSSPYQHRPSGQRPMNLHPQGHPHQLHQSQMFYNHHSTHPLRPFNDGDSMATRAMAEMTKRMEDASRLAAAAANQRFVDHLQSTPISQYCLTFKQGKRENTENFSPSPPKQMLLDSNRHQIQSDQSHSIPHLNGVSIKLANSGDGATTKDDSLMASMEINGVLYKGVLYPQKKQQQHQQQHQHQQQQQNGETANTNNDANQSLDKKPNSPVIDVNEAE